MRVLRTLVTFLATVATRVCYRLRASGTEHVPAEGPALLALNHQSWVDAFAVAASARRSVRFVMDHRMAQIPGLRWLFRLARVIPIASRRDAPSVLEGAYDAIDAALAAGEVVAIFPEGRVTRDGRLGRLKPGIERILARRTVPVVPVGIQGLWGSMWSFRHGPPLRSFPRRFRARVRLRFGVPLRGAGLRVETLAEHLRDLTVRASGPDAP